MQPLIGTELSTFVPASSESAPSGTREAVAFGVRGTPIPAHLAADSAAHA